ncbi:MAG: response regulator [Geobacteraceae bacterium]|nr:response regulator [Geobacteraceae bacterium]
MCNNAVYAMDEVGILEVAAEAQEITSEDIPANFTCSPGRYAMISVRDSGCGIPDEMREQLFDPFFSSKKAHEGTGMGLATVQGIVLQHGGFICVESCVGEGSTFRIYLPVAEEITTEEPITSTGDRFPRGTEQILYVDDEEMLAELAEEMLTPAGYQVSIMSDSSEALMLFRENAARIDLLITDQTMPGLTGTELIAEMKKIKPELPVILCTGHSNKVNSENAHQQGVHAYLEKPLTQEQLLQTVRHVLDEYKE